VSEYSDAVADLVVDCTGLACPVPVVKTAQAIKTLARGHVLELIATDPGVEPDIRAWTSRTGHDLLGIDRLAEVFHILIRRVN
jgi:tRNA 2-thiouridine synthesizing protein A